MQTLPTQLGFDFAVEIQKKPEPFLKWAGGKGQLLNQIEKLLPSKFNRYYEPFLGGGALFFHLQPAQPVLNDLNTNLVATYRHIQQNLDSLLDLLQSIRTNYHQLSLKEQEQEYYKLRTSYNQLKTGSVEKAALLIFLNKTGYNGLYRESKKGGFNVPFGRYDNPAIFDETNLKAVAESLRHTELHNANFDKAVESAEAGDFVYFDPPYVPVSKTASFTSYTAADFDQTKQKLLAKTAQELAEQGVFVMISNSDTEYTRTLYQNFYITPVKARRAINSKAEGRGKITELLITSYPI